MMPERFHMDLFSGLGGFTLAAHWNGIKTIQFVEIDKRCRDFLSKTWLGVPIHDDIKTFKWAGSSPFILTGGVPCQPASRAGKQRGCEDDRWLWGETIRVLAEVQPTWALFENPPGIGDVGLAGILSEVEACGYEVRVVGIPACAVGSPQIRMRYWIVAHTNRSGQGEGCDTPAGGIGRGMADAEIHGIGAGLRHSGPGEKRGDFAADGHWDMGNASKYEPESCSTQPDQRDMVFPGPWSSCVWLPCADGKVRRSPDNAFLLASGLYAGLHQQLGEKEEMTLGLHRSVLGALGNAIVPQVAATIIRAMIEAEP
jgi:DNA (cytosine-5)-methyltransferase 1